MYSVFGISLLTLFDDVNRINSEIKEVLKTSQIVLNLLATAIKIDKLKNNNSV